MVTGLMTIGVVDLLEMVVVDHHTSERLAGPCASFPVLVEKLKEGAAIKTASQGILRRQDLELPVLLFHFVATVTKHAQHLLQFRTMLLDVRDIPKRGKRSASASIARQDGRVVGAKHPQAAIGQTVVQQLLTLFRFILARL